MEQFKIMWVAHYFPTHDHRFAPQYGPSTENDYWFLDNTFSIMDSAIRLP